jgi:hypothetical protein
MEIKSKLVNRLLVGIMAGLWGLSHLLHMQYHETIIYGYNGNLNLFGIYINAIFIIDLVLCIGFLINLYLWLRVE